MTDFDHAEISRHLALAIGHEPGNVALFVRKNDQQVMCWVTLIYPWGKSTRLFDYRDPLIAWSVAERFNCFPTFHQVSGTWAVSPGQWMAREDADTAALAVAMAVIKAKEGK